MPRNTVLDDITEFVDPVNVHEHELEFVMIPSMTRRTEKPYQKMVDRSHKRLVQSLVGPRPDVDMATVMRMERSISAQGF